VPTDFCPFVHRVWIALELLGVDYRYVEVDPYKKTQELLEVNPKGLVPALKIGEEGKCLGESTVILEYLADRYASHSKASLFPLGSDPYTRALHRLESDKINRSLIPAFYRYLQAQEEEKQAQFAKEFVAELETFTNSMKKEDSGSFWDGSDAMGWVDIMVVPWIFRADVVLRHFRGFQMEDIMKEDGRFSKWTKAAFNHPAFKATTSGRDLYLDSYARYSENRPNTSQVANAINSGREFDLVTRRALQAIDALSLSFCLFAGGLP
jgi:glutathione S-transferase